MKTGVVIPETIQQICFPLVVRMLWALCRAGAHRQEILKHNALVPIDHFSGTPRRQHKMEIRFGEEDYLSTF